MTFLASAFAVLLATTPVQQTSTAEKQQVEKREQTKPQLGLPGAQADNAPQSDVAGSRERDAAKRANSETPKCRFEMWLSDFKPGDAINLVIACFTGAFLVYTIRMWREMVRQNNNAENVYREGASDTDESLRLTRESNEFTQRTMRAYLMVDGFKTTLGYSLSLEFNIHNVGATVAKVGHSVTCMFIGAALPDVADLPDYASHTPTHMSGSRYIYPGKYLTQRITPEPQLPDEDIREVMDATKSLFVFGRIEYEDVLGAAHVIGWSRRYTGERFVYQSTAGYEYVN